MEHPLCSACLGQSETHTCPQRVTVTVERRWGMLGPVLLTLFATLVLGMAAGWLMHVLL